MPSDEVGVLGIAAQLVDERLVDLDHVDGELAQVRERRVTGSEVIDRERDTRAA